jgi:hypothetical protein
MRVGKGIIDYSFKKSEFGEELGELARVSAGNPFRCSDSAVKLSALAVRLEKPFRFLICRYWHCDLGRFIREELHLQIWKEKGVFFGTCEGWGVSFELGAFSINLLCVFH